MDTTALSHSNFKFTQDIDYYTSIGVH